MNLRNYLISLTLLVLGLVWGCIEKKPGSPSKSQKHSKVFIYFDINKFKHRDLTSFSVDTLGWEARKYVYQTLDSNSFDQVYQDTLKHYQGQYEESVDLDFYYSTQKNNRGFIECTFLSQREGEYCDRIFYNIYSSKGKLISSFRVAGSCADGGYYEKAWGKFVNDSTYVLESEDNYRTIDVDKENLVTHSRTVTIIRQNESLKEKTITVSTTKN